jgi:DNA-binding HxlR family transcriptional regulator
MVIVIPAEDSQACDGHRIGRLSRDLLHTVGDTWSALAVFVLYAGPLRFTDVKQRMDEMGPRLRRAGISHKMLAETLRGLRRNGLVARSDGGAAVRAEYGLTPLGQSFRIPMMAVHEWTAEHIDEIEAARMHFDAEVGGLGESR